MHAVLQARLPGLSISISSEVSPQLQEFERFNTVCANAYIRPLMQSYLDRLVHEIHEAGGAIIAARYDLDACCRLTWEARPPRSV